MDPKRWSRPVTYAESRFGDTRTIVSTGEAAKILTSRWPTQRGLELRRAQKVCTEVLAGKRPPSEARQAFLDAAKEAAIVVKEG